MIRLFDEIKNIIITLEDYFENNGIDTDQLKRTIVDREKKDFDSMPDELKKSKMVLLKLYRNLILSYNILCWLHNKNVLQLDDLNVKNIAGIPLNSLN